MDKFAIERNNGRLSVDKMTILFGYIHYIADAHLTI